MSAFKTLDIVSVAYPDFASTKHAPPAPGARLDAARSVRAPAADAGRDSHNASSARTNAGATNRGLNASNHRPGDLHRSGFDAATAARPAPTESAYQGYQIMRRNGAVVSFEPNKIAVALMKAFLAVHGTQGAASASVRETVDGLTESVVRGAAALASGRRHLPHRGRAGPGRARPDARRRARGRACLRAVPRAARAGARHARAPCRPLRRAGADGHDRGVSACRSTGAPAGADRVGVRRPRRRRQPEPILAETLRNLYDGVPIDEVHKAAILAARTLIEKDPGYTRATARLLLHTIRREVLGEEVLQADMHDALRRVLPAASSRRASQAELLDERLLAVRPRPPRRGAQGRARPAVRLPRPADALRPLLPAHRRRPHRAAAGVLHARGDGPGAERDRPRGARDRVLRSAVDASTS